MNRKNIQISCQYNKIKCKAVRYFEKSVSICQHIPSNDVYCQGCHSHKISKFPDFFLNYLHFSLTNQAEKIKTYIRFSMIIILMIIMCMSINVSNNNVL